MAGIRFPPVTHCIFCHRKADSREHLWSSWMLDRVPHVDGRIIGLVGDEEMRSYEHQRALRIKCVCQDCNNGWMSRSENAVKPIVGCMMSDLSIVLNSSQQHIVSAWALKTAMVWEYTSEAMRRNYYSDEERAALRVGSTIPPRTDIWLARHAGPGRILFTEGTDLNTALVELRGQTYGYVTTIVLERLVFQIVSVRTPVNELRPVVVHPKPGPWERVCIRLWPTERDPQAWPPPMAVDAGVVSLDDLVSRWSWRTRSMPAA